MEKVGQESFSFWLECDPGRQKIQNKLQYRQLPIIRVLMRVKMEWQPYTNHCRKTLCSKNSNGYQKNEKRGKTFCTLDSFCLSDLKCHEQNREIESRKTFLVKAGCRLYILGGMLCGCLRWEIQGCTVILYPWGASAYVCMYFYTIWKEMFFFETE